MYMHLDDMLLMVTKPEITVSAVYLLVFLRVVLNVSNLLLVRFNQGSLDIVHQMEIKM